MAVVSPLKYNSGDLQELSSGEVDDLKECAIIEYASNPSVTLTYNGSPSGGNLTGAPTDTRYQSGVAATSTTGFVPEGVTGEPTVVSTLWNKIDQTIASTTALTDTDSKRFPVYYNGVSIQAMSLTDFRDTFIHPALLLYKDPANSKSGTYKIHTASTLTNYTAVDSNPIYTDTKALVASYTAANIGTAGTTQSHYTAVNGYYLLKRDQESKPSRPQLLYIDSTNNLKQYSDAELDALFESEMRHCAATSTGNSTALRYQWNSSSGNKQTISTVLDTVLTGVTGTYTTYYVNTDDYRAQEFPNGTETSTGINFDIYGI